MSVVPQVGASPKVPCVVRNRVADTPRGDADHAAYRDDDDDDKRDDLDLRCVFLYDDHIAQRINVSRRCSKTSTDLADCEHALLPRSIVVESVRVLLECCADTASTTVTRAIGYRHTQQYLAERVRHMQKRTCDAHDN